MKTKFFKKLSFVLVVAMVLSLLVPAAGVFAATKPELNSTKKYLHLGRDDANEFNFNISNKSKGWKYDWESSDDEVVEVNEKNGVVTAQGVGKAKVTVYITDADGEEVTDLTATVTVRDNIEEVTIKNPVEKLAVGAEYDFNRSFVTESGSTKKTSAITRWTVSPAEGAEIKDDGKFTATEGGKYTVTAHSFQSKAKYEDWKLDPEKYVAYELDTDTTEVTVADFIVEAKQKNLSKVNVLFSSPMSKDDVKKNVYINYMIGDVAIKEQAIKDVEMSADGLTATVEIYDTFVPKVTYRVTYTDMEPEPFIAATTNPEDVVGINITTTTAKVYVDTTVAYELINKDGVVINQPVDVSNLGARVTFENSNEMTSLLYDKLMIFKVGETTTVTATYHTYDHDANGNEKVYKDAQLVIGTEDSEVIATDVLAWTIVTDNDPKYDDVKHFIAAGDLGRRLFVQVQLNDNDKTKVSSKDNEDLFKLTSSDSSVLFVDELGYLVPLKQGKVRVTVEYDDRYVGAFEVTVSAERKATRLVVEDTYYANVSNSDGYDGDTTWSDDKTIKVNLKDQYGDNFADNSTYASNLFMRPLSAKARDFHGSANDFALNTTFAAANKPEGKYQYLVYDSAYEHLTAQVVFDVKTPVDAEEAASFSLNITGKNDDGNLDVVVKEVAHANKQFTVELMAVARNGVKIGPVDLSDLAYDVNVRDPKGKPIVAEAMTADKDVFNTTWTVSGGAIEKLETGRYTVDILEGTSVKARGVVVVVDSQTVPVVTPKSFRSTDATSSLDAFMDSFTVKIGDDEVLAANLTPVFHRTSSNTRALAKSVFVRQDIGTTGLYIVHEVNVGFYITVPVNFDGYSN